MKTIIFLTDNIFTKRDFSRFDIQYLRKNFKVKIISFLNYINPQMQNNHNQYKTKELKFVNNFHYFQNFIEKDKNSITIDFLGFSLKAWKIRHLLKKKNIKIAKFYIGSFPLPKFNFFKRLQNLFDKRQQSSGNIFHKIKLNYLNYINRNYLPDIAIVGGDLHSKFVKKKKFKHIIHVHSWDYDAYLKLKNKKIKKENYAVFIDSNVAFHPDYLYHQAIPPVNASNYFNTLELFFDKFQKNTGLKIKFAASPKTDIQILKKYLPKRKFFYNQTLNIVKNSKLVLMHASTSIFFPLKFGKPTLFLTSNDLKNTWFGYQIAHFAKLFNKETINMDSVFNHSNRYLYKKLNKKTVQNYMKTHDKLPNTHDNLIWKTFTKYIIGKKI